MNQNGAQTPIPDLSQGVARSQFDDGSMMAGRVGDYKVLLIFKDGKFYAVGSQCTHYNGPLEKGLLVDCSIRCPWHHARFDIDSGAPVGAPGLDALPRWRVQESGDKVYVRERIEAQTGERELDQAPSSVVIIGGGATGDSAAVTLRRLGYKGPVTILSADTSLPCDRPNLSKGFLTGQVNGDAINLRPDDFYTDHAIDVRLRTQVTAIDTEASEVTLADGEKLPYGALLLATGSEPAQLSVPGVDKVHVHYLRSRDDSEAIAQNIQQHAAKVVIVGASFIGLEVASSLRQMDVEVHVVAPEARPLEKVMGAQMGDFIRTMHEHHGVHFHLGQTLDHFEDGVAVTEDDTRIDCDLVVAGIGVKPRLELAKQAGFALHKDGIEVDKYLQTSVKNVYAAGDIANWPDPISGERIRVEHWVLAQRHGQMVARNMLGAGKAFSDAPFFWTKQYDLSIRYVGHSARFDEVKIDGNLTERKATVTLLEQGREAAMISMGRDMESLEFEATLEKVAIV